MSKGNLKSKLDRKVVPVNKNRAETKKARGKGVLAMKDAEMSLAEWTRNFDPLFGVKGKERHRRLCS